MLQNETNLRLKFNDKSQKSSFLIEFTSDQKKESEDYLDFQICVFMESEKLNVFSINNFKYYLELHLSLTDESSILYLLNNAV